ncbi:MAG: translocation/assembly module TamB domain-containing protein [Gemmatimonadota bacterium]
MKLQRRTGLGLAALIAIVLAAGAYLLGTEPGARLLLGLAPGGVRAARVEGTVLGQLTLQGIEYATAGADVTIDQVRLDWKPMRLLRLQLRIDSVTATGVTVRRKTVGGDGAPEPAAPAALPDLTLPVEVRLGELRVSDVLVYPPPGETTAGWTAAEPDPQPLRLDTIVVSGSVDRSGRIRLSALDVQAATYRASASGRIEARGDYPLDVEFSWHAPSPEGVALKGKGRIEGDLKRVDLRHDLTEPVTARLTGRATAVLDSLTWRARLDVPEFRLDAVRRDLRPHSLRAEFEAAGGGDRSVVGGTVGTVLEDGMAIDADLHAVYSDGRLLVDTLRLELPGGGELAAEADVDTSADPVRFSINGRWSNLAWPPDSARLSSIEGRFSLAGSPADYEVSATASLGGTSLPPASWSLAATGSTAGLLLERIAGHTLGGDVRGSGMLAWAPQPGWRLQLIGEGFNLARAPGLDNDWQSRLSFGLRTEGSLEEDGLRIDARVDSVSGDLRGEPVSGRLQVSVRDETIVLDTLLMGLGKARLAAGGMVGDAWDVGWSIQAPDLSAFTPAVTGSLAASGHLSGRRAEPNVQLSLRGDSLGSDSLRMAALVVEARIDLSGRHASELTLEASGLEGEKLETALGGDRLPAVLHVTGGGTPTDHRMAMSVYTQRDTFTTTLAGGARGIGQAGGADVEPLSWQGEVERLTLATPATRWSLREAAALRAGTDGMWLRRLCWDSADGEICLSGEWVQASGGNGRIEASEIRLGLLAPFLPPEVDLEGSAMLVASGRVGQNGELTGEAHVSARSGELRYRPGSGESVARALEQFRFDARARDGRLEADGSVVLEGGRFDLSFAAPLDGGQPGETVKLGNSGSLSGRLVGEIEDRGLLGSLVEALDHTTGVLRVELDVGGTLSEPSVGGEVTLHAASAAIVPLGIEVDSVEFEAVSDAGRRWRYLGRVRSPTGSGALELEGNADLGTTNGDWTARFTLRGDSFPAYRTVDAAVTISPDLVLRAAANGAELSGEVRIPAASLTPGEAARSLNPSTDVVFVGVGGALDTLRMPTQEAGATAGDSGGALPNGAAGAANDSTAPMVRGQVRLVMGDSVHLDAFGVAGRLEGDVVAMYATDRPMTARGQLDIKGGTYTAYRQKLVIERGRLLFAGGPVTNPGLDLRVVRRPEDVLVGLQVSGTAETPQTTLFSEPPMADSEALSYLVLGRSLSGASQQDGELLANAANSAGLAGGSLLAARLGATFGLDQAKIERDGSSASLLLGTYITPKLYFGYSLGLFEAASLITIRYELGKGWVVQTESGFDTGGDILYTLER